MKNWELIDALLKFDPNAEVEIVPEKFKSCEVKEWMPIGQAILSVERCNPVARRTGRRTIIIRRAL